MRIEAMAIEKQVRFIGYDCDVHIHEYQSNKQKAIQLVIANTEYNQQRSIDVGESMTIATACLPGYSFADNETAIKDYSENTGVLDVLLEAGIVELTGKVAHSGFAEFPIVRIRTFH
jgi:hypothetical protein